MISPSDAKPALPQHHFAADDPPNVDGSGSDKTHDINNYVEQQKTSEPELADQTHYLPRRYIIQVSYFCGYLMLCSTLLSFWKTKVFLACASVGMTGLLDETMVAVALPIIASDLNTGGQITAVATAYFMSVESYFIISCVSRQSNGKP